MKLFVFVMLLLIIIAGLFVSIHLGTFNIKKIDCFTQFGQCQSEYIDTAGFLKGYPLYQPLPRTILSQKYSSFIEIRSINFYRRLPSTLIISIELRKPIGIVSSSVLGAKAIVDDQGLIFDQANNSALPLLISSQDIQLGSKITSDQLKAINILNIISAEIGNRIYGFLSGSELTAHLSSESVIIVDTHQSFSNWGTSLQLILNRSKINGKMPRKIDLRFNNPIITY